MAEALRIRLFGIDVGLLEYFPEHEDYVFTFDESYLSLPDRPVIGQIFEDFRPAPITTSGMPCWFANLLPQHRLRNLLASAIGVDSDDNFHLLETIGGDLPGAVEALPAQPRLTALVRLDTREKPYSIELPPGLKFSLAGVQMKLSVRAGERGFTIPARGETGRYIAKFDDPTYPNLPRIEYSTLRWAEDSGISVPQFRLSDVAEFSSLPEQIEIGNGTIFMIQRFDRVGEDADRRVHMEDFAQILDRPPGDSQYYGSYEQIAAVLANIAHADLEEFIRRLVFTVLSGNGDAHLKNWTVLYPDRRHAQLSPAYDFVSTILYYASDTLALTLGGSKRFGEIGLDRFDLLSKVTGVASATMREWVTTSRDAIVGSWETVAHELPYSEGERSRIEAHMRMVPLTRQA